MNANTNVVLLFSAICLICGLKAQEPQDLDCQNFRTGVFVDKDKPLDQQVKISRTDKYQIEEYEKIGVIIKMKVVWLDDCSYRLEFVEGNKGWHEKFGEENDEDMIIKIIETGKNFYIQASHFTESDSPPYISRLHKISEIER